MTLASVLDLVTTCPKCGGEVGIWSEDAETLCTFCEHRMFDKENTIH
jgi:DNA-directed RNA polymerase subunit RPC12/RpoP